MNDVSITEMGGQALLLAAKLGAPDPADRSWPSASSSACCRPPRSCRRRRSTFVPKFIAVGAVLLISGNWMLSSAVAFTHQLFDMLPRLLRLRRAMGSSSIPSSSSRSCW